MTTSNLANPIETPDWVRDAVFYQIFPDRFARRDDTEALIVVFNAATEPRRVSLPVGAYFADGVVLQGIFGQTETSPVADGKVTASIRPRSGIVLAV